MEMNDNTILRIKVPAHLYEAVKAQLTLKEAKGSKVHYGAGMEEVKVPKTTKTHKASKPAAPKNAEAPKEEAKVPHDGMKKAPKKKLGLEELKAIVELLNGEIAQLEEKTEKKKEKSPVEESVDATIKEYEVIYVVRNGKCYRKDDEGNMDEVSMSKCRNMEEATDAVSEYKEDPYIATQRVGLAMKAIDAALSSGKKVAVAGKPVVSHINAILKTDSGETVGLGKNVGSITIDGQPLDLEADLEKVASKYQGVKPVKGTAPKWSIPDKYRGSETPAGFRTGD